MTKKDHEEKCSQCGVRYTDKIRKVKGTSECIECFKYTKKGHQKMLSERTLKGYWDGRGQTPKRNTLGYSTKETSAEMAPEESK